MAEARILQLIGSSAPSSNAALLQRRLGQAVRTLLLPPRMMVTLQLIRSLKDSFDLVHAFGLRALTAAALGTSRRIVFTPDEELAGGRLRWLRAVMHYRDVQIVFPSDTMQRSYVERGVPIDRCRIIRPGADFSQISRKRDAILRQKLGFEDDDRVMLLVGRSTRASGHLGALWAAAILHVLDPKYRVLAWGAGSQTSSLIHFARSQKQPKLLTVADSNTPFESLFGAADLLLVTARKAVPVGPIAAAMASGLPIVGVASRAVSELLEDRHTALLTTPGEPRALTRRILDLDDDPSLARQIGEQARTEAYEYFSLTRFVQEHKALYDEAAAVPNR